MRENVVVLKRISPIKEGGGVYFEERREKKKRATRKEKRRRRKEEEAERSQEDSRAPPVHCLSSIRIQGKTRPWTSATSLLQPFVFRLDI